VLVIPFPLVASLQDYKNEYENYFFYYGRWSRKYFSW
jgi:hypothetical protein